MPRRFLASGFVFAPRFSPIVGHRDPDDAERTYDAATVRRRALATRTEPVLGQLWSLTTNCAFSLEDYARR
jgi:hypothetical protein